jgi:hypothetical protein
MARLEAHQVHRIRRLKLEICAAGNNDGVPARGDRMAMPRDLSLRDSHHVLLGEWRRRSTRAEQHTEKREDGRLYHLTTIR